MSPRITTEQSKNFRISEPDTRFRKERPSKAEISHKLQVEAAEAKIKQIRGGRVRGTRGRASGMNKIETAYAAHLEAQKLAGEIAGYWFESVKFRLADRTWFEIDFMVLGADGEMQMHEVKAIWKKNGELKVHLEDDANVKIKVAAELYPFRFVLAGYYKKEFTLTEV